MFDEIKKKYCVFLNENYVFVFCFVFKLETESFDVSVHLKDNLHENSLTLFNPTFI